MVPDEGSMDRNADLEHALAFVIDRIEEEATRSGYPPSRSRRKNTLLSSIVQAALSSGAQGYVLKIDAESELVNDLVGQ